jgi:hypothetical protein
MTCDLVEEAGGVEDLRYFVIPASSHPSPFSKRSPACAVC